MHPFHRTVIALIVTLLLAVVTAAPRTGSVAAQSANYAILYAGEKSTGEQWFVNGDIPDLRAVRGPLGTIPNGFNDRTVSVFVPVEQRVRLAVFEHINYTGLCQTVGVTMAPLPARGSA